MPNLITFLKSTENINPGHKVPKLQMPDQRCYEYQNLDEKIFWQNFGIIRYKSNSQNFFTTPVQKAMGIASKKYEMVPWEIFLTLNDWIYYEVYSMFITAIKPGILKEHS